MHPQPRIVSRNLDAARRFYSVTARPLGLAIIEVGEDGFALGRPSDMEHPLLNVTAAAWDGEAGSGHVALDAPDDFSVRAFFRAALEAGGQRAEYPAPQPTEGCYSYYAAKVIDPDGNCIECGWRH